MTVLGLSCWYHDAAFPTYAAAFCLAAAGVDVASLDAAAFYDKPLVKFERLLETCLTRLRAGWHRLSRRCRCGSSRSYGPPTACGAGWASADECCSPSTTRATLRAPSTRQTGYPVLVNTSCNERGAPIVHCPSEAVRAFLRTHVDTLAIGPFVLTRASVPEAARCVFTAEEIANTCGLG